MHFCGSALERHSISDTAAAPTDFYTSLRVKGKKNKTPASRGELFLTFSRSDAQQRDEEKPAQHGQHRGRRSGQPRSAPSPSPSLCAPQPRDQGVKLRAEESPESLGEEEEEDEECAPQGRSVRFDVRRKWGFLKKKEKQSKTEERSPK